MEMSVQPHTPAALNMGQQPHTNQSAGGWVGPAATGRFGEEKTFLAHARIKTQDSLAHSLVIILITISWHFNNIYKLKSLL
jgi:hypothetical protein